VSSVLKSATLLLSAIAVLLATNSAGQAIPLSPGDRLRILTPADDDLPEDSRFRLSGVYEVDLNGNLNVPFIPSQTVAGLEPEVVERQLFEELTRRGYFKPEIFQISVNLTQLAPAQVSVAGEIFLPGRVLVNALPDLNDRQAPTIREQPSAIVSGGYPPERYLTTAIRLAGGLKPTADVRNVKLIRGEKESVYDLSGVFTGEAVPEVPLIAGDQVVVPRADSYQAQLVRPSQLTPLQIPVIISNQTSPMGRGGQIVDIPYGSRFSQAMIAAGCAGGNKINSKRRAALVQTDRATGRARVFERKVESLIKNPGDPQENPYLMPLDSVVCYDSTGTSISSVLRIISDVLSPFFLIREIFNGNN